MAARIGLYRSFCNIVIDVHNDSDRSRVTLLFLSYSMPILAVTRANIRLTIAGQRLLWTKDSYKLLLRNNLYGLLLTDNGYRLLTTIVGCRLLLLLLCWCKS